MRTTMAGWLKCSVSFTHGHLRSPRPRAVTSPDLAEPRPGAHGARRAFFASPGPAPEQRVDGDEHQPSPHIGCQRVAAGALPAPASPTRAGAALVQRSLGGAERPVECKEEQQRARLRPRDMPNSR
jgi:hypothetical protein